MVRGGREKRRCAFLRHAAAVCVIFLVAWRGGERLLPAVVAGEERSGPSAPQSGLSRLVQLLAETDDPAFQRDILRGMYRALNGRRSVKSPAGWSRVSVRLLRSSDAEVRRLTWELGVVFGDAAALQALRQRAGDPSLSVSARQRALLPLVQRGDAATLLLVKKLLREPAMRRVALRSLAAYNRPEIPALVLKMYPQLKPAEKQDAVLTLASRPSWALQLLSAVEKKQIPTRDLSAFVVRQMTAFQNATLNERIRRVWGSVRATSAERKARLARYKSRLTAAVLKKADLSRGRLLFRKTCATCHRLYDEGKRIGPELTGAQRSNLDYLLENILDPNAVIGRDYRLTVLVTTSGRLITGIIREETDKTVQVQTANERIAVDKSDIEIRKQSPVSLMPEGQLDKLSPEEVRDLIAYLMHPVQVPLPANHSTKDNR